MLGGDGGHSKQARNKTASGFAVGQIDGRRDEQLRRILFGQFIGKVLGAVLEEQKVVKE